MTALASPAFARETPVPPRLTESLRGDLEDGDIVVNVREDGDAHRAELVALVDGSAEDVWAVITDFDSFEDWVPDQVDSTIVEARGANGAVFSGETRVPILRNRTYQIRDRHRIEERDGVTMYVDEWDYIDGSGNMEENEGYWIVMPYDQDPSKTLIRMVVFADLGMMVPQAVIQWGTRRALPELAEGIREQTTSRSR